ncbi:hypothetical protein ES703_118829 [subsurface metagenome]
MYHQGARTVKYLRASRRSNPGEGIMTTNPQKADITVRGGTINVPKSTQPTLPLRHQPNTPPTKKKTKTRPDHQVPTDDSRPQQKPAPEPQKTLTEESPALTADPQ